MVPSSRGPPPRRTFSPEFKLRVLDAYQSNDPNCRGNQRATARKFGIHRRQVQKWLQIEEVLRSQAAAVARTLQDDAARAAGQEKSVQGDKGGEGKQGGGHKMFYVTKMPEPLPLVRGYVPKLKEEEKEGKDHVVAMEEGGTMDAKVFVRPISPPAPAHVSPSTASDPQNMKRRSFTLQFKLSVLDAFHRDGECRGNQRATARQYGINRRQVQKWLNQERKLRNEAMALGGLHRQRLAKGADMPPPSLPPICDPVDDPDDPDDDESSDDDEPEETEKKPADLDPSPDFSEQAAFLLQYRLRVLDELKSRSLIGAAKRKARFGMPLKARICPPTSTGSSLL